METHADVLLVTVTDVETRAVFDAFCGKEPPPRPIGRKTYHDLGIVNGASVWHVRSEMGAGGLGAAQQAISDALTALSPGAVILVGIAFGMDETKQAVGDVLVSRRLTLYDIQRVGTENGEAKIIPRGPRPDASTWLLDCFRNANLSWKEAPVRFGVILTGEKLVDNLDFREQLRALEPEAIGGEMEGGGLYVACHDAKVDWILVKGICDWADGKKPEKKGERQRLAARNAARLIAHTLKNITFIPDSSRGGSHDPTDDELLQAFATPLRSVADDCSKLATRGLSLGGDPHQKPLRLAHVYVSLDTKTPHPSRKEKLIQREEPNISPQVDSPLSALEALFNPQARRVVLVGEPGSGKSTFLQYVTLCLADQLCAAPGESSHLAGLPVPDLIHAQRVLPLRVLLRDFAPILNAGKPGTSKDVETFLLKLLEDRSHADAAAKLPALLKRGLAFVQFDGLDEVPKSLLPAVRQAITAFAEGEYQKCRVAVTCRTESYKKQEFNLASFPAPHEIAPLPTKQRAQFIHDWYLELEEIRPEFKGEGAGCAASLLSAIATDRLREMAGNPFFLTAMAALHRPEKPLPDTSAELMHQLVNSVLEEARKRGSGSEAKGREPELAVLLKPVKEGIKVLRLRLEAIAYKARDDRQDRASRFVDKDLLSGAPLSRQERER
ncbi:MAG: NACHT domain-containing protein [Verrucomicrobia bacterium]|nr:NACHT domain-containing protein [Verrucomicrobiota bacterium]